MKSGTFDIDAGDSFLRLDTIHYSENDSDDAKKPSDSGFKRPRMVVQSITSKEFEPFSHFFVVIGKAFHLTGCAMHSLFLKIRTVPSIPIIETSPVWCIDSEVDFRSGYALDFTSVPSFTLGEYTPVIEFYRRQSSNSELFAFAILPLKVREVVQCDGQTLTFLYKNDTVELRHFTSGQVIGSVNVIIALGFPRHQQFLDPNRELPTPSQEKPTPEPEPKTKPEKVQKVTKVHATTTSGFDVDAPEEPEETSHRRRRRRTKRRKDRRKKNLWIQKATAYGWKPPGYVDPEWRDRARERGWKPPNSTVRSSIGVTCDPMECRNMKDIVVQTEPPAPKSASSSFVSRSSTDVNLSQSEDDVFALIDVLNKNNKAKKKPVCGFMPAECVFSMTGMENMRMTPVLTLMDVEGKCDVPSSSDDDDDVDLQQSLHEIVAQSMSSHGITLDLSDSDDETPTKSTIEPLRDIDKFLKETLGSSDDEEEDSCGELGNEHVMVQHLSSDSDDSDESSDAGFMVDHLLSKIEGGQYGDKELEALMNVYRS